MRTRDARVVGMSTEASTGGGSCTCSGRSGCPASARAGGTLDSAISDTAGLVGFWRLGASS